MRDEDYPALFLSADAASNRNQALYLCLIRSEYILLIFAAFLSMEIFEGKIFYLIYSLLFFALMAVLITRTLLTPEQDWYRCRALAESVKTLTWRYMMRAAPFENADTPAAAKAEFRNHLQNVFDENRRAAEKIDANWSAKDQVTREMEHVRGLFINNRRQYYTEHRVTGQRQWYTNKAAANKRSASWWVGAGIVAYSIAAVLTLSRIGFPDWKIWPIEPVIVVAASILGWTQIKKFNELGAAYTITAHEIGLMKIAIDDISSEDELTKFVTEAELAFSREHTLWLARQNK